MRKTAGVDELCPEYKFDDANAKPNRFAVAMTLQRHAVRCDPNEFHLHATDTKVLRARDLSMSQRLRALLEMRRLDAEGQPWPPSAYVFGAEIGGRIKWSTSGLSKCGGSGPRGN